MLGVGLVFALIFVLMAKAYPDLVPNRVDTWINRIENFNVTNNNSDANYQIERAKTRRFNRYII